MRGSINGEKLMKNILSLVAVTAVLYIFTFYVDGEMGVIIIFFLLAAALISLAFAVYGRNRIKISFNCDAYVKKGNTLEVTVTVEKEGRFPLAVVEIKPYASQVFGQKNKVYRLSLVTENRTEFTYDLLAEIGGNGEISIAYVYSCGFLGFLKFRTKQELPPAKSVGVIPEIPDVTASSQLFRNIADAVMTSDNDEDNDTVMLFSASTFPGYEHREYVPGDSMKRVNWKLSSKTSKLMVRLDEAASAVHPCIALDLFRDENDGIVFSLKREERLLQAVFGLISLLVKQGIACSFVYRSYDGSVLSESVDNPDYPAQLLLKVLAVKLVTGKRLDLEMTAENFCACIIATTDISGTFSELTDSVPNKENVCVIVPDEKDSVKIQLPVWYLTDDNNFKLV